MAKGKKKRGKKNRGDGGAGGGANGRFWTQLVRETLGNFAGQLMADNAEKCVAGSGTSGDVNDDKECDVAADVLRALGESGSKPIAALLTETGAGLTPLLTSLRVLREFRLIEIGGGGGGDDDVVQLTGPGTRTASALRRDQIESDGRKLLQS
jgi:hypothetical protein